jgi:pSer/pThr/pTyr-binding forkhead associated (FHA) protein
MEQTITSSCTVGQHLEKIAEGAPVSYLMFNKQKIGLVAKMTIGRNPDCTIVVDDKLASRVHATIQKIKDVYFVKDEGSTNGTFLNGHRIADGDNWTKLNPGDKITIGSSTLVLA